eukprot:TRINITY_DN8060_c0_g1_i1.p1 TRINITY_DN8060_c0_g1~~TRINITY_DN8060_c0_g1_i1.p1  ORF type:complete len:242 (-),score=8.38 TRINITY_DN8060_c0_g1_i1:111-836(-)
MRLVAHDHDAERIKHRALRGWIEYMVSTQMGRRNLGFQNTDRASHVFRRWWTLVLANQNGALVRWRRCKVAVELWKLDLKVQSVLRKAWLTLVEGQAVCYLGWWWRVAVLQRIDPVDFYAVLDASNKTRLVHGLARWRAFVIRTIQLQLRWSQLQLLWFHQNLFHLVSVWRLKSRQYWLGRCQLVVWIMRQKSTHEIQAANRAAYAEYLFTARLRGWILYWQRVVMAVSYTHLTLPTKRIV